MLPTVIADLRIPLQEGLDDASWAVSGYFLTYALGIAVMGRASDALGRRTAYLVALSVFGVGSVLAALSGDVGPLVADATSALVGGSLDRSFAALYAFVGARLVQGLGAGAMLPVSLALVGDLFTAGRRSLPLGVVAGIDTAGWVFGHLYGGLVVQILPWPWIFWSNLPLVAVAFAGTWVGLRGLAPRRGPFEWRAAVALGVALGALDLALSGSETGATGLVVPDRIPPSTPALLVVGAVAGYAFFALERRSAAPLFGRQLIAAAGIASAINLLVGVCLIAALVSVPLVMNAAGATSSEGAALASGAVLATFTIPMAVAAVLGGWIGAGPRTGCAIGLALAAIGSVLVALAPPDAARQALAMAGALPTSQRVGGLGDLPSLAAALALTGIGLGLSIAPLTAVVIDASPAERHGSAASLVIALRLLGMMVGTSVLTTFGVRRWAALAPSLFAEVPLDQPARLADVAFGLTARIADEMVLAAAAMAALAALVSLRLPARIASSLPPPGRRSTAS